MIAILNTEIEALELSNDIHNYLLENRTDYNAELWQDLNKSDNAELWAVILTNEYNYEGETIEKFPEDWKNIDDELKILL